ncbi:hypothetical protein GCM10010917_38090 [Paenibacillus physcomitrellae]|uniref:Uncharacterized protein n=1 Tax=Paenibacillus physcomitrellae TaxID=1619311 RepID=A0ABQ1GSH2_9BACL|nr:hypothetical protein GCM10010917_38090 [Paenibacillus physcomitrellae]
MILKRDLVKIFVVLAALYVIFKYPEAVGKYLAFALMGLSESIANQLMSHFLNTLN